MKATREGKRFLIATVLIAVAAVNTGNNLIYLILSLMLAIVFLSVLVLQRTLSGLAVNVSASTPVFAGDETPVALLLKNAKKAVPSYSIILRSEGAAAPAYFPVVPPRGAVKSEIRMRFMKRGLWGYGNFRATSGFPFILLAKEAVIKVSGEVLVYPALRSVEGIIPDRSVAEGDGPDAVVGPGEEIHSLREFRYGDDWRKIHWKASAKSSGLLVREYARHEFRKTTIVLDNLKPEGGEHFEKAVSAVGSLARHFLEGGHLVRVLSCRKVVPFGGGEEQLYKILDILAVIREEDAWDSPVTGEQEGIFISVLKSPVSAVSVFATMSAMVIYADTL